MVKDKVGCTITEDSQRLEITDLEIDGLLFEWIESKVLISCAVITQLICTFALHKGFLMMLLMFLVVILVLFPSGKSLILLL